MASTAVQHTQGHPTDFVPSSARGQLTSPTPQTQPNHVSTSLNYYKDTTDGSPPAPAYIGKPETYNRPTEPLSVTVHDIRGEQDRYTLDKQGFQLYNHNSVEKDFLDDAHIKAVYYPETEQLLKDATGASRVFIFDHTLRRATKDTRGDPARGPVKRVHIDQSYPAARNRIPHHLPAEAKQLLRTRHQIINVWRPIKAIYKDPLGVADARSVPEEDLVPIGLIYPDRKGETLSVRPNENHRWYYAYGQQPSEVTLIKCYDSKLDGRARRVPHTAFENPATADREPRESIEVRALVFHESEVAE